jgi:hypothetical protein
MVRYRAAPPLLAAGGSPRTTVETATYHGMSAGYPTLCAFCDNPLRDAQFAPILALR